MRAERINRIAKLINAKRYLEVGVCDGNTFFEVEVPHKVAVDPKFLFDTTPHANAQTVFHPIVSDEYFRTTTDTAFDLIFLDGLHTFEQTYRDFTNSLSFAHDKTVWIIDDTVPIDNFAALPDQMRCGILRQQVTGKLDWSWMGDVYKVIFLIRSSMMFYDFKTFEGHGQTAVWKTPTYNARKGLPLTAIGGATYEDLIENFAMLNSTDADTIIAAIAQAFEIPA